jgi:hypothetical protein
MKRGNIYHILNCAMMYMDHIPYFSIDNRTLSIQKSLNSLKVNMRGIHLKGSRGKSDVR